MACAEIGNASRPIVIAPLMTGFARKPERNAPPWAVDGCNSTGCPRLQARYAALRVLPGSSWSRSFEIARVLICDTRLSLTCISTATSRLGSGTGFWTKILRKAQNVRNGRRASNRSRAGCRTCRIARSQKATEHAALMQGEYGDTMETKCGGGLARPGCSEVFGVMPLTMARHTTNGRLCG